MKTVSTVIFTLLILVSLSAYPNPKNIQGSIYIKKELNPKTKKGGVLFVFARKTGQSKGPPSAVLRIAQPRFPLKFTLGPGNAMIPNTPFTGPFTITAKFSPTGNALQKEGTLIGTTKKTIQPGAKDVSIVIDKEISKSATTKIKMH